MQKHMKTLALKDVKNFWNWESTEIQFWFISKEQLKFQIKKRIIFTVLTDH